MSQLREIGTDVMVFHVLDPAELNFPYTGKVTLEDMETEEFIPLAPEQLKAEYKKRITTHIEGVARVLGNTGADHVLADTSRPLDDVLFRYLLARQDRKRRGSWASPS